MDQGLRFLCQAEVKRLLFLFGATFALVIAIQYFEFPFNTVSSLFSVVNNSSNLFSKESPSLSNTKVLGNNNTTLSNALNSTFVSSVHETINRSEVSFANKDPNYVGDSNQGSFNSSGFVSNGTLLDGRNRSLVLEKGGNSINTTISFMNATEEIASVFENNRSSDTAGTINKEGNAGLLSSNYSVSSSASSASKAVSVRRKKSKKPVTRVFSISQMNDLLRLSRASSNSLRPQWLLEVDRHLMLARSQIENAPGVKNDTVLYAPIYRNVSMFERSYELMENMLKVYIYQEGEKPIFHQSILEGIYASEGWFIKLMEANEKFVTKDPKEAHLFYIPFSSRLLELTLYVRKSHSRNNLIEYMKNYTDMIAAKYSFWNRTGGADHFVAACHDWAPAETRGRMLNCIRALCNADIDVGFSIGKDVSLPETYVRSAQNPLKNLDGNPPSQRPILAFFAGNVHGFVRPILLEYWENKEPDMKIFGPMPRVKGNASYIEHMKSSKYCICPRGHEVNSPRIVESIFYECVPVIISDNFVPTFLRCWTGNPLLCLCWRRTSRI